MDAEQIGAEKRAQCIDHMKAVYLYQHGDGYWANYSRDLTGFKIDGPTCIFRFRNIGYNQLMDRLTDHIVNNFNFVDTPELYQDREHFAGIFKPMKLEEIVQIKETDLPRGYLFPRMLLTHYKKLPDMPRNVASIVPHWNSAQPLGEQPFVMETSHYNYERNLLRLAYTWIYRENRPDDAEELEMREPRVGFTRVMRYPCELDANGELIYDLAYVFQVKPEQRPRLYPHFHPFMSLSKYVRVANMECGIVVVNLTLLKREQDRRVMARIADVFLPKIAAIKEAMYAPDSPFIQKLAERYRENEETNVKRRRLF